MQERSAGHATFGCNSGTPAYLNLILNCLHGNVCGHREGREGGGGLEWTLQSCLLASKRFDVEVGNVTLGMEAGEPERVQRKLVFGLLLDVAGSNVVMSEASKQRVFDNGSDQELAKTARIRFCRSRAEVAVRVDAGNELFDAVYDKCNPSCDRYDRYARGAPNASACVGFSRCAKASPRCK